MSSGLWDGSEAAAIERAAQALVDGQLVAFPTETVYGLGARADDDRAVAAIFSAKGRPADHPLIVHVSSAALVPAFTPGLPPVAERLIAAFWPGPLTLIVARRPGMAAAAAGGQVSIGLRCPSHPIAHALLQAAERLGVVGVAAPSANRFGRISPTLAEHVLAEFGDSVPVLDGGACDVGIESTIVDCTRGFAVLLRPGVLTAAAIEAAIGEPLHRPDAEAPRASGTLASHYAPRARLHLLDAPSLQAALARIDPADPSAARLAVYSRSFAGGPGVRLRVMSSTALGAAHELFAALRELDAVDIDDIWVEAPPETPEWAGVLDRLQRAAAE